MGIPTPFYMFFGFSVFQHRKITHGLLRAAGSKHCFCGLFGPELASNLSRIRSNFIYLVCLSVWMGLASQNISILNGIAGPSDLEDRALAVARALILIFGLFQHKHRLENVFA